jgi:hypothetical protein
MSNKELNDPIRRMSREASIQRLRRIVVAVFVSTGLVLSSVAVASPAANAAKMQPWEKQFVKDVKDDWDLQVLLGTPLKKKWKNDAEILRTGKGLCDIYADPAKTGPDGIKYLKQRGLKKRDEPYLFGSSVFYKLCRGGETTDSVEPYLTLPLGAQWERGIDNPMLKPGNIQFEGIFEKSPDCTSTSTLTATGIDYLLTDCPRLPLGNSTDFVGHVTSGDNSGEWYKIACTAVEFQDASGQRITGEHDCYGASDPISSSGSVSQSLYFAQMPGAQSVAVDGKSITLYFDPIEAFNKYIPSTAPRLGPHAVWPQVLSTDGNFSIPVTKPQGPYYK